MTTASNLSEAVKSNFLDLDGGVMNGTISMDEIVSMKRSSNESYMQINGGSSWGKGASLELFGKDHTSKGKFLLWAHNGTDYSTMEGFPDGYLTWNNKQVVCVSTWRSDNLWYRVYDDGYIEQGGLLIPSSGDDDYLEVIITLPVSFTNANYSAVATGTYTTITASDSSICTKKSTTQVGFKVHSYKAVGYPSFYCCGY